LPDYEQSQCTVANGATPVSGFSVVRGDALNITGLTDTVAGANSQTLGYSAANRLNSASGAYGSKTWIFDGVGNRTFYFALRMPTRIRAGRPSRA
jgi:hypothetical protein